MKKTLLLAALVLTTTLSTLGQGVVNFNNRVTADINGPLVDAPITLSDGTTRIAGTGYTAALYGAPGAGAAASSLTMLANPSTGATTVDFRTGAAAGYVNVGAAGARIIPGAPYGSQVTVQIRAWSTGYATYELAAASGLPSVMVGTSGLITMGTTTGPTDQVIPRMNGLAPFSVNPVPEPSSIALGLLGLGAIALIRRRK